MFNTIKLNKEYWQKIIPNLKYGVPNPLNVFSADEQKFSVAMTGFNFSGVYKTTQAGRHKGTQHFIKEQLDKSGAKPVIIDIGASDGSTSLDFIKLLGDAFSRYYVTDYNIKCTYASHKGYTYFFNQDNECFLAASVKFVFYPANKWLFNLLFKRTVSKLQASPKTDLLLINKELQELKQKDNRIEILQHNIFNSWQKGTADIIVIGNLIHRAYFSDEQIAAAITNCYNVLTDGGLLVIIRNALTENGTEIEKSNVYQKDSAAKKINGIFKVNGGVEIDEFMCSLRF